MEDDRIFPGGGPFLLPGGRTGCLLLHGFTSMPEEMRLLGEHLHSAGFSVYAPRLAGHATHPDDLARTAWQDWLATVEESLVVMRAYCDRLAVIGQSMGGIIALIAAARYPLDAAVAISTPYDADRDWRMRTVRLWSHVIPVIHKGRTPITHPRQTRRERDYPAYPFFPTRILAELEGLKAEMRSELGRVKIPILLVHSRKDHPQQAERLLAGLQTQDKELFWLENAGHSIVLDAQRGPAFDKIVAFLRRAVSQG